LRHPRRRRSTSSFHNQEFAAALAEAAAESSGSFRQRERKALQLCRQVQRALNLALAESADEGLSELYVDEVSPAPDCGHLTAHVVVPGERPWSETLGVLAVHAPRLRGAVAEAITRKRAPELSFVPVPPAGGAHD
jgi:ribosome-binding factor A